MNQIAKFVTVAGIILAPVWGYFSLQRDTADNKSAITENRAQWREASSNLAKQVSDGQEKTAKQLGEIVTALNGRIDAQESAVRVINENGTNYGRTKVDARMESIDELKKRVGAMEIVFQDVQEKIGRIGYQMEQVWGDYKAHGAAYYPDTPPQRIDPAKVKRTN